jgi:AP-1 complex subunit beta-1
MQKIYRKYPTLITHENGLKELIEILDQALEELAKASAAWIIGEFAEEIPKCIELITTRIEKYQFCL